VSITSDGIGPQLTTDSDRNLCTIVTITRIGKALDLQQ